MSDTIALLNKGRLEQVGTPQELYLQPKTRFAAGFLRRGELDGSDRSQAGSDPDLAAEAGF